MKGRMEREVMAGSSRPMTMKWLICGRRLRRILCHPKHITSNGSFWTIRLINVWAFICCRQSFCKESWPCYVVRHPVCMQIQLWHSIPLTEASWGQLFDWRTQRSNSFRFAIKGCHGGQRWGGQVEACGPLIFSCSLFSSLTSQKFAALPPPHFFYHGKQTAHKVLTSFMALQELISGHIFWEIAWMEK